MTFSTEKAIKKETQYKRGFNPPNNEYVISASMVAKEPLQNYLTILYGNLETLNQPIDDSDLGSVFHKGMEQIILAEKERIDINGKENEHVLCEHTMHKKLINGWYLSGTADLIIRRKDGTSDIEDHKLTKTYALKMIKKDILSHDYTVQLQVLDLLNWHENPYDEDKKIQSNLAINVFCKDAKAINKEVTFTKVTAPNAQLENLESSIVEITSSLQAYIEEGEIPPKCEDIWLRKLKNGTTIATKCALYCSHGKANHCPYYESTTRESVNRLINW